MRIYKNISLWRAYYAGEDFSIFRTQIYLIIQRGVSARGDENFTLGLPRHPPFVPFNHYVVQPSPLRVICIYSYISNNRWYNIVRRTTKNRIWLSTRRKVFGPSPWKKPSSSVRFFTEKKSSSRSSGYVYNIICLPS